MSGRVQGEWLRVAGARHGCDLRNGAAAIDTDCKVGGERAIAFAAIVGRLAGTSVTAIEQPLTESDVVGAVAIGEKAIVADTMEAVWQSVQQKAADEIIGIECHHLGDAALSVVFPGEAHLPLGEREEPAVCRGKPMGKAAEISQHPVRATRRWPVA